MSYKKLNGEQCYVQKADGEWGKESLAKENNIQQKNIYELGLNLS